MAQCAPTAPCYCHIGFPVCSIATDRHSFGWELGAGEENRTLVIWVEASSSTIELHPHIFELLLLVGVEPTARR